MSKTKPTAEELLAQLNGSRTPSAKTLDEVRKLVKRVSTTMKAKRREQAT